MMEEDFVLKLLLYTSLYCSGGFTTLKLASSFYLTNKCQANNSEIKVGMFRDLFEARVTHATRLFKFFYI